MVSNSDCGSGDPEGQNTNLLLNSDIVNFLFKTNRGEIESLILFLCGGQYCEVKVKTNRNLFFVLLFCFFIFESITM